MYRHFCFVVICVMTRARVDALTTQPATAPYVQAIELVSTLEKGPDETLIDSEAPLDDRTAQFLSRNEKIFTLLHEAAVNDRAEWSAKANDLQTVLPSLNPLRSLANLGVLRARMQLKQQMPTEAVESLLDVKVLGRNISRTEMTMVANLVAMGIDSLATDELAQALPTLPREVVRTLPDRLKQLPAPVALPDLIRGERRFGAAMLVQSVKGDAPKIEEALGPFYDAVTQAWEKSPPLSRDDFKQALNDAVSKMDGQKDQLSIGLVRPLLQSFVMFYQVSRMQQAKAAMLEAGILVVRDGPDAIQATVDPFGDRPFKYEKMGEGFRLRSALTGPDGKPVEMRFGK